MTKDIAKIRTFNLRILSRSQNIEYKVESNIKIPREPKIIVQLGDLQKQLNSGRISKCKETIDAV